MRNMRAVISLTLLSLSLLFGACAAQPDKVSYNMPSEPDGDDVAETSAAKEGKPTANRQAAPGDGVSPSSPATSTESIPLPKKRMIQRDGRFVLESSTPLKVQEKIEAATKDAGGFVIEANRRSNADSIRGTGTVTMTLRIPAEKFDGSLGAIRKAADRVVVEEVKGKDVTAQYVDIQARLKAKKALEEQFLTIMKQAKGVQDALTVQRELANVRTQIERIEGQKRLLESRTSLSTIKITINPPGNVSSGGTGFWYQLQDAFNDGFEAALTFILVLVRVVVALIPFLIIIGIPLLLILYWLQKRIKRNRMAREILKEQEKEANESE